MITVVAVLSYFCIFIIIIIILLVYHIVFSTHFFFFCTAILVWKALFMLLERPHIRELIIINYLIYFCSFYFSQSLFVQTLLSYVLFQVY
jgi:hypothetical protein